MHIKIIPKNGENKVILAVKKDTMTYRGERYDVQKGKIHLEQFANKVYIRRVSANGRNEIIELCRTMRYFTEKNFNDLKQMLDMARGMGLIIVNDYDDQGYSALHYICDRPASELVSYEKRVDIPKNSLEFVKLLCKHGANPLRYAKENPLGLILHPLTPIGLAAINKRWDAVDFLMSTAIERNLFERKCEDDRIADWNDMQGIYRFIKREIRQDSRFEVDRECTNGLAAFFGLIDRVTIENKTIMEFAVDLVESQGENSKKNGRDLIELLCRLGSDPSKIFVDKEKTRTVFHRVFQNKTKASGFFYVAKIFVDTIPESVLAAFRDADGNTVYHLAAESDEDYILSTMFTRTGLDKTIQNNAGETPLDIAERHGNAKVAEYLKRQDAKVAALVSDLLLKA